MEEKIPIRGWLIVVAIILWITPIAGSIMLAGAFSRLSWLEMLLIIIQEIVSIIVLIMFYQRKRMFIYWFMVLLGWSTFSAIVSTLTHYTDVPALLYNVVGNIVLLLYCLRSQRVRRTFVR